MEVTEMKQIRIGTCSFNYPSWKGLVYSGNSAESFLTQYARRFDTVEVRNKQYFNPPYFDLLREHDLSHVFMQGYWIPPITETYARFGEKIGPRTVLRLMGEDRR
jgi:hypothetical protein